MRAQTHPSLRLLGLEVNEDADTQSTREQQGSKHHQHHPDRQITPANATNTEQLDARFTILRQDYERVENRRGVNAFLG